MKERGREIERERERKERGRDRKGREQSGREGREILAVTLQTFPRQLRPVSTYRTCSHHELIHHPSFKSKKQIKRHRNKCKKIRMKINGILDLIFRKRKTKFLKESVINK